MAEGTGLNQFAAEMPERFYDVGIAEEHAVCFAAGMATAGARPVCAIYSTFLQRAYDQIVHDVAIQKLPVVFVLDRAGLVGPDGPTHHGTLDLSYLSSVPGMVVAAPKDGTEMKNLLYTALQQDQGPFAIRYPKDQSIAYDPSEQYELIPIGKWETIKKGAGVAIVATGSMVPVAEKATLLLTGEGIDAAVINARYIKPLDRKLLTELAGEYETIVTVEEGTLHGGLGSQITQFCQSLARRPERIISLGLPDNFVTHGPRSKLLADVGLTPEAVVTAIKNSRSAELLPGQVVNRLSERP